MKIILIYTFVTFFSVPIFPQGIWVKDTSAGFTARRNLTSSIVNGKIYIIGGGPLYAGDSSIQIFDPFLHKWSNPIINNDLDIGLEVSSETINGSIFVFGGLSAFYSSVNGNDTLAIFNPSLNTWSVPAI